MKNYVTFISKQMYHLSVLKTSHISLIPRNNAIDVYTFYNDVIIISSNDITCGVKKYYTFTSKPMNTLHVFKTYQSHWTILD